MLEYFQLLLYGRAKGGLCQKEILVIVLNCSISPGIPWAAGNNLTSAVLFYFFGSNTSLCGDPHECHPADLC